MQSRKAKQFLLPALDKVTDLKSCVEFYKAFCSSLLYIHPDENFGKDMYDSSNEGLLNLKVFDEEEYLKHLRGPDEKYTAEEEWICKRVETFKSIKNDPVLYAKAMEGLESRKNSNIEILRGYGLQC